MKVEGLQKLYQSDPIARQLVDGLSKRQRLNPRELTANSASEIADCEYWEAVQVLKQLGEVGVGDFKVGRRGKETRIEWSDHSVRDVIAAARDDLVEYVAGDEDEEVEVVRRHENGGSSVKMSQHRFRIRPDLEIVVMLPVDMSQVEAERLGTMIQQSAFDR